MQVLKLAPYQYPYKTMAKACVSNKRRLSAPFLQISLEELENSLLLAAQHAETLVELLNTTTGIHDTLLTSVERVTL